MNHLVVYLNKQRVGELRQDDAGLLQFSYDLDWVRNPSSIPLSRSLPLQDGIFPGKKARPFFAGILPEQEPRKRIAEILGITGSNDFAMLESIGGDCAGAVSLLPEGAYVENAQKPEEYALTESELERIIADLPQRPLMVGSKGMRLSLAGAQNKLPVILQNDSICLPLSSKPSTHILKPEPDRFPGLAVNELFCMKLSLELGLNTPDTEFRKIGNKPCIIVKRYDREIDKAGTVIRLHQEDFCQALGFPPERKYQGERGPSFRECIILLREWSTTPVLDIPQFINGLIFNVLIGNADAHAKNFSFLYSGNERRLAPYYDLVSTIAWDQISKNLAMYIGNCQTIDAFNIGDWKKMAEKSSLGWPLIRERMEEKCQIVLDKLEKVKNETVEHNESMVDKLNKTVCVRAEKILKALAVQSY